MSYKGEWNKKWRKEHPEEFREQCKRWNKLRREKLGDKYLKFQIESSKRWRANNPLKVRAYRLVFCALRNGSLEKKKCFCGNENVQAHHDDYTKPLDVRWLCKIHHILADKARKTQAKI